MEEALRTREYKRAAAEPVPGPATPFPRFERISGRPAEGGGELEERESEIPRMESAGELRERMTRRRLRR